jgi:hypothetical protein
MMAIFRRITDDTNKILNTTLEEIFGRSSGGFLLGHTKCQQIKKVLKKTAEKMGSPCIVTCIAAKLPLDTVLGRIVVINMSVFLILL